MGSVPQNLLAQLNQLPCSPAVAAATLFRVWSLPKEWGPHFEDAGLASGWRLQTPGYATLQECNTLLQLCLPALARQEEAFPEQTGLGYNSLFSETQSTNIDWDTSSSGVNPEELAVQMVAWLESTAITAQKARALGEDVDMQLHWAISAANAMQDRLASIWLLEANVSPEYTRRALSVLQRYGSTSPADLTPAILPSSGSF